MRAVHRSEPPQLPFLPDVTSWKLLDALAYGIALAFPVVLPERAYTAAITGVARLVPPT